MLEKRKESTLPVTRVPSEVRKDLEKMAKKTRRTLSDCIRIIITDYLFKQKKEGKKS